MSRLRRSLPRPISLILDCARQGNIASAIDTGLHAVEVAAAPVALAGVAGASAVIGWPVYAALAAGLLGIGVWNAIDDRKDKARIKATANALKKLADDKGSLTNAAAYMLKQERESKRPLELPYALADNAAVALYETLTARHDDLANTLAKHEGFYVSLGSYLDEHFDDFKNEFKLAQQDRNELRGMLHHITRKIDGIDAKVDGLGESMVDVHEELRRITQLMLTQTQANPNATPVLSDEDKALLDQAKSHGDLKSRAAASVLRPDAETDNLLRQLRDRLDTEAFDLDMLEGKRWHFAGEYDKAIELFERAMERRKDNFEARNHAAIAHTSARQGDIAAHRLRAIEIAEGTLKLVPDHSTDWAKTQGNLGVAWENLPTGDRAANLGKAIACYELALEVYTRAAHHVDWAGTQLNLGVAFGKFPYDRGVNLTKAIAYFKSALKVLNKSAHPAVWAMTQNNLGNAWAILPTGDRATNLAESIANYESALEVFTRFEHPMGWAATQHNLGIALAAMAALPGQDKCGLLRRAIAASKGAFTIRTPEAFPREHASTLEILNIVRQTYEAAGCAADIPFDDIPPAQ